jgi:hypothetical protein
MALRILTQVNYSAGENADGDSGLRFTAGLVKALVHRDRTLHFYILVPDKHADVWRRELTHPRITLISVNLQPRLHGGDFQFDPLELYRKFDFRKYDVDLLFLNQPEIAPAFLQFFNRQTFHNVPAISYLHWFDLPAMLAALSGMMTSFALGCNSAYGREIILSEARRWFHADAIKALRERIRILPPGIDLAELGPLRPRKRGRKIKIIVNHRLLKYTGVRSLLTRVFPQLWKERRDFSVTVTNPSCVRLPRDITEAPWIILKTLPRLEYVKLLQEMDVVVSPHRATHWSISTVEAVSAGCVPLMNVESFFPEMFEPVLGALPHKLQAHVHDRWFYYRGTVIKRLHGLLDHIEAERKVVRTVSREMRDIYGWNTWVDTWLDLFHSAEDAIPIMADRNPSMIRIFDLLRTNGAVSKETILRELSWAPKQRALSWTSFRKRLRVVAPDDSDRPEAVFRLRPGTDMLRVAVAKPE